MEDVSQTLEEINVLTVKVKNENARLADRVHLEADVHKKSEKGGNSEADEEIFFVEYKISPEFTDSGSGSEWCSELFCGFSH